MQYSESNLCNSLTSMVVTLVNKSGAKQQGPRDSFITLLAQPEAEVS